MQNNNYLVIDYNPFVQESQVYIYEENQQRATSILSDLKQLAKTIVGLAYENNIFNIKIQTDPVIVTEMINQTKELEQSLYSENKITIEGI